MGKTIPASPRAYICRGRILWLVFAKRCAKQYGIMVSSHNTS